MIDMQSIHKVIKSDNKRLSLATTDDINAVNNDDIRQMIKGNLTSKKDVIYDIKPFDVMDFVSKTTTSPTVEKEDDGEFSDNHETLGGVREEDEIIINDAPAEIADDGKAKVELTRDEIAFVVELFLEGLDWLFVKGMAMADRHVTKTTDAQKRRIIDAVGRISDKYEFKITPELSLMLLILITYGVKAMRSKEIKQKTEIREEPTNKVKTKLVLVDKRDEEKLNNYKESRGIL